MEKSLEKRVSEIEEQLFIHKSVFSFEEASAFLNLSKSYLYKLTSAGLIPHYKPQGKMLYFEKSEVSREKFKNSAADVGSALMDGVGSLLGSSKTKRLQSEVEELRVENTELKENLGNEIKQLKNQLRTAEAEHKSAIGKLLEQLEKVVDYFPQIKDFLRWEAF